MYARTAAGGSNDWRPEGRLLASGAIGYWLWAMGYWLLAIGKAEFGYVASEIASRSLGENLYIVEWEISIS